MYQSFVLGGLSSQRLLVDNDNESYVEVSMAHVKWFQEHNVRHSFWTQWRFGVMI